MIKTLYLSYDGLTDPLGQSQILPYIIQMSSKYKFTIITLEKRELVKSKIDTSTTKSLKIKKIKRIFYLLFPLFTFSSNVHPSVGMEYRFSSYSSYHTN